MAKGRSPILVSSAVAAVLALSFPSVTAAQDGDAAPVATDDAAKDSTKESSEAPATEDPGQPEAREGSASPEEVTTPTLEGVSVFVLPKNEASVDGAELLQSMMRTQVQGFANVEMRSRVVEHEASNRSFLPSSRMVIGNSMMAMRKGQGCF